MEVDFKKYKMEDDPLRPNPQKINKKIRKCPLTFRGKTFPRLAQFSKIYPIWMYNGCRWTFIVLSRQEWRKLSKEMSFQISHNCEKTCQPEV